MNAMHALKAVLPAVLLTAALSMSTNPAGAQQQLLKSSNLGELELWHGRAGGTVGAERVTSLSAVKLPPANVGVAYDKDVAERTHMNRGESGDQQIGIIYDRDIAKRTNMSREQQPDTSVLTHK